MMVRSLHSDKMNISPAERHGHAPSASSSQPSTPPAHHHQPVNGKHGFETILDICATTAQSSAGANLKVSLTPLLAGRAEALHALCIIFAGKSPSLAVDTVHTRTFLHAALHALRSVYLLVHL